MGLFSGVTKAIGNIGKSIGDGLEKVGGALDTLDNPFDIGIPAGQDAIDVFEGKTAAAEGGVASQIFLRGVVTVVGIIFLAGGVFLLGRQND